MHIRHIDGFNLYLFKLRCSLRYLQFESRSLTLPTLDPLPTTPPLPTSGPEPVGKFIRSSSVGTLFDPKDDCNNTNNNNSNGSNNNQQAKLPALLSPPKLASSSAICKFSLVFRSLNIT